MFKKNKFKGGLLSDVVSPEVFQEMTGADCNQGGCKPSNQNEGSENSEAKPAEGATAPATDATPSTTETKADTGTSTTENTDDASWKSKPSEPASENTDDGNQGCKKSSNQSEYAEEIGLVEIDMDAEVPSENTAVEIVDGLESALEATDEIIEQKMIMDEAAEAGNLSVASIAIFKQNAERYMSKMHGEGNGSFDGKYIDPDNSGLQSDNPESLKSGLQGVWDSVIQTVQSVILSLEKAGLALENTLIEINKEIELKINKEFMKVVWIPFKARIESNIKEGRDFILSKGAANNYIKANYSSAKLLLDKNNIDSKDMIKLMNEVIDYYKEDKLPEVKKEDKDIQVSLKSMGERGELEKAAVEFLLAAIKKGDDGKSIFREIWSASDRLMLNKTTEGGSKDLESRGHNPNDIKADQVRAYALSERRVYAMVFSKDGKHFLHDFIVDVPYNFIFGRSDNVQAKEELVIGTKDMKSIIDNIDDGIDALNIKNRGKQKTKVNLIAKVLEDDIKELKAMIAKNEFTNWKLWKQYRQNILSISRVYPQIIRLSATGLFKHLVATGKAIALVSTKDGGEK